MLSFSSAETVISDGRDTFPDNSLISNGSGTIFTAADAKTETDMSSVTKNNLLLVINDNRYLECLLCLFVFTSSFNVTGPISRETCFAVVDTCVKIKQNYSNYH